MAGRPAKTKVKFEGIDKLIRITQDDQLYAEPWRRVLLGSGDYVLKTAKGRAPGLSGRIASTLFAYPEGGVLPHSVVIPLKDRGAILTNYGGWHKTSRYRVGPRTGRKMRSWFIGAVRLKAVKEHVRALIKAAVNDIEHTWGRAT